jgi:hypothetical protein
LKHSTNLYAVFADDISSSLDRSALRRLLGLLDGAVSGSVALIEGVSQKNSDYAYAVTDDECDHIEDLLGVGFVVGQVAIKSVVTAVNRLDRYNCRISGSHLTATTPQTVMKHGLPAVAGQHSAIEVMNAAANYFKHREEWVGSWDKLTGQQTSTASVITSAGAAEGSTGNLRRLAKVLGNAQYARMVGYCDAIERWVEALHASYNAELTQRRLIPGPRQDSDESSD